ncbi:MAG: steroid delta-isomerase [Mycobacteriaceae bacterium]|nr:steroid delta-isomerase [Mycobacterium sp.]NBP85242.1 steroid delta-isomerase [Mycobacteriaceae bacterium]NBQ43672.1 steroid delta-isomerase [Mycobacteriaceae bacterium]
MPSAEHIRETVNRYLALVAGGSAEEIAALFADDATLEDPVGGEVHIGRGAIRGFFANIEGVQRETELHELRVAGHEAAFLFTITVGSGEGRLRIRPIDVMVFDSDGKVAAMKAYWAPEDASAV